MGRHNQVNEPVPSQDTAIGTVVRPAAAATRSPFWTPLTTAAAIAASLLVVGVAVVPYAPVQGIDSNAAHLSISSQSLDIDMVGVGGARDTFSALAAPEPVFVPITAPAAGVPDPGSAQAIAYGMMPSYGFDDAQYNCLVALWSRESGWNTFAHNSSSGAYGIPQALPGEKMASAGADWATNPATQIAWGLGYITGRYGTPCGAWEHSELKGWY